jgi:transposase-like protein
MPNYNIQPVEDNPKRKRSVYSKAKKVEVVKAYKTGNHTMDEVKDIHGIKHASLIHRWVKEFNQGRLHATKRGTKHNTKGTKPYKPYANRANGTNKYTKDTTLYSDEPLRTERDLRKPNPPITPFSLPNGTQLVSRVSGKEVGFGDNHVHVTLEIVVLPVVGDCIAINRGMANEIAELFETPNLINTLKGRAK